LRFGWSQSRQKVPAKARDNAGKHRINYILDDFNGMKVYIRPHLLASHPGEEMAFGFADKGPTNIPSPKYN
jgi:hypothetical protein